MLDLFVDHITPACPVCGERSMLRVDPDRLKQWLDGAFIQVAFPEMTDDDREQLKTGTHPECWDKLWTDEDPF